MVCDVYGIKSDRQFVNTLEDNIQEPGAPTKQVSDGAQVEISEKVQDILCNLAIGKVSHANNTRIQLNAIFRQSKLLQTLSLTILVHLPVLGCCAFFMYVFS